MTDLFSSLLSPILSAMQQFLDASFSVLALFGISAPNVTEFVNSILGISA